MWSKYKNNFGFIEATRNPEYTKGLYMNAQADDIIKPAEDKARENALDLGLPQYIAIDACCTFAARIFYFYTLATYWSV